MERPTILFVAAEGPSHAIVPLLEKARWAAAHPEVESVFWQDSDGFEAAFAAVAKRYSPKRLGVLPSFFRAGERLSSASPDWTIRTRRQSRPSPPLPWAST